MSASLVGSEMCIRDSTRSFEDCPVRALSVLTRLSRGLVVLKVPMPAKAVSYTHLTLPTICSV
eukprot:7774996-Alexandrium_andersonii.AAC.1